MPGIREFVCLDNVRFVHVSFKDPWWEITVVGNTSLQHIVQKDKLPRPFLYRRGYVYVILFKDKLKSKLEGLSLEIDPVFQLPSLFIAPEENEEEEISTVYHNHSVLTAFNIAYTGAEVDAISIRIRRSISRYYSSFICASCTSNIDLGVKRYCSVVYCKSYIEAIKCFLSTNDPFRKFSASLKPQRIRPSGPF